MMRRWRCGMHVRAESRWRVAAGAVVIYWGMAEGEGAGLAYEDGWSWRYG